MFAKLVKSTVIWVSESIQWVTKVFSWMTMWCFWLSKARNAREWWDNWERPGQGDKKPIKYFVEYKLLTGPWLIVRFTDYDYELIPFSEDMSAQFPHNKYTYFHTM